jgi:hypothetical protein
MVSGSDRSCEKWLDGYQIDGADGLGLHQLYRAMQRRGNDHADHGLHDRPPCRSSSLQLQRKTAPKTWSNSLSESGTRSVILLSMIKQKVRRIRRRSLRRLDGAAAAGGRSRLNSW